MINELEENETSRNHSKKNSKQLFLNHLKQSGFTRRKAAEADEDEQEAFHEERKKAAGDGRHRSLYRPDQEIRPS